MSTNSSFNWKLLDFETIERSEKNTIRRKGFPQTFWTFRIAPQLLIFNHVIWKLSNFLPTRKTCHGVDPYERTLRISCGARLSASLNKIYTQGQCYFTLRRFYFLLYIYATALNINRRITTVSVEHHLCWLLTRAEDSRHTHTYLTHYTT